MHRLVLTIMAAALSTPGLARAADENAGKAVFNSNCSVCHSAKEALR